MRLTNLIPLSLFWSCVIAKKFDVTLSNDITSLLRSRSRSRSHSALQFLENLNRRGWSLTPVYPQLMDNEVVLHTNATCEIPNATKFRPETIHIMRKHGMHTFYSVNAAESSLEEVREALIGDHGIVKSVSIALGVTTPVESEYQVISPESIGHVDQYLRTDPDYSVCKKVPCQAYLYLNDKPSQYKAPGNNIVKVWEEFEVKGEDTRILIFEAGTWSNEPHNQIKQKPVIIGTERPKTEHKTNIAGMLLADHSGKGIRGIAPNTKTAIDVAHKIDEMDGLVGELFSLVKKGDVMTTSMSRSVTDPESLALIGKYYSDCAGLKKCGLPLLFDVQVNAVYNSLHEMGVTMFISSGNTGTILDTDFWKKYYPTSKRGKQKVAVVTAWDAKTNALHKKGARVRDAKKSKDHIRINFANWGSQVVTTSMDSKYITNFLGSSASTPLTAGVALLVQSASKKYTGKYMSPDEVIDLMHTTGRKLADATNADMSQTRLPDAYEAVKAIKKKSGSKKALPDKKTTTKKKATTKKTVKNKSQ